MNTATLTQNNRFTLEAGTTNRHQWHKQAVKSLATLDRLKTEQLEKSGVFGEDERESIVMIMFGDIVNTVASDLYSKIGESFGWLITKDNAADILAATLEAIPAAREAMPVIDQRKSPAEVQIQADQRKQDAIAYDEKQAAKNELQAKHEAELIELYPWAMADNGKISGYARAAKNMKKELKIAFPHIKFSVKSDSFSMGNSISVSWSDGCTTEQVDAITEKYQYYINKCEDKNSAYSHAVEVVLGQSKYVSTSRTVNMELREQVGRDLCKEYGEEYSQNTQIGGRWLGEATNLALCVDITGDYTGVELINHEYVAQFKAIEAPTESNTSNAAAHIEEHEHTKKGFMMYMVILDESLERDIFNEYRSHAQSLEGWYSRKWGTTPNGFAFKEIAQANAFLSRVIGNNTPRKTVHNADKLRTMADKLTSQIADKHAPRLENTHKRQGEARRARSEGDRLQRTQTFLRGLADMQEAGTLPTYLNGINTKKAAYELASEAQEMSRTGEYFGTGKPYSNTPAAAALWELLTPKSDDTKKAEALADKIRGLQFSKIDGYFPTPKPVIDLMLEQACIDEAHAVLEPSAGSGAICDAVADILSEDGKIDCFEVNYTLRETLEAKGYNVAGHNFMETAVYGLFDRVIMNPPFEKLQDIEHIKRAFSFLKDGGRLVAIMSPSAFYREDRKSVEFRAFFDRLGGEKFELPEGSFKESGTGINTIMIVLDA